MLFHSPKSSLGYSTRIYLLIAFFCTFSIGGILAQEFTTNVGAEDLSATDLSFEFGDSLSKELDDHAVWQIRTFEKGEVIKTGTGSIENYQCTIPGKYTLYIPSHTSHLDASCTHQVQPEEITFSVSPYKMKFDFSKMSFSSPIIGDADLSNIKVTVEATLQVFGEKLPEYNGEIKSAGIGANITGHLKNGPVKLKEGVNKLTFTLSGNAKSGTYIMLDFYNVNNKINCYYLTNPLK